MQVKAETAVGIFILASLAVLIYMSFQIGSFRLATYQYTDYTLYFHDISGLNKKADVKIAGVKVGWVDHVAFDEDCQQVKARIMILKQYRLYADAHGTIRQDGILGGKHLEIVPGNPHLPLLPCSATLTQSAQEPVYMDELLRQFKKIAANIESVTGSLKESVGGEEGTSKLKQMIDGFNDAAQKIASFSASVDRLVAGNEKNLAEAITDFSAAAQQIEATTKPLQTVFEDIKSGKGIVGQLMYDDATYRDIKQTVQGIKTYFNKVQKLGIVFDVWSEYMFAKGENAPFRDLKGYFNVRIHPVEDYFYLAGVTTSRKGIIDYQDQYNEVHDICGTTVDSQFYPSFVSSRTIKRFSTTFNLQFGKIFNNLCIRGGLFESTGGLAFDLDTPIRDQYRWVSTFEMFDFPGQYRLNDRRPHLKWLNKMFITPNLYMVLGFDDFISKHNKSMFAGFGIRFADDDVKYFMPSAPKPSGSGA